MNCRVSPGVPSFSVSPERRNLLHFLISKRLAGHFIAGTHSDIDEQTHGHGVGEKIRAAVTEEGQGQGR